MLCPARAMAPPLITHALLWSHPSLQHSPVWHSAAIRVGGLTRWIAGSVSDHFHAALSCSMNGSDEDERESSR